MESQVRILLLEPFSETDFVEHINKIGFFVFYDNLVVSCPFIPKHDGRAGGLYPNQWSLIELNVRIG